jgi:uncharacterized protein (TIGR02453 family)
VTFRGWPPEALAFFEGLEADNSKAYWQDHKGDYEHFVLRPMSELLSDLESEFGEGRIFRPYRDVRFSRDKSPYKTNIAATLNEGGYISFSADGLGAGSGYYMMASDQLDRFRHAIDDDRTGKDLEKIVKALEKSKIEVSAHDALKTAPKGYPKDHPRIDLLRQKGLIAWKHWPAGSWLGSAQAKKRVVDLLHAAQPMGAWLDKNVGPTTEPAYR